MPIKAARDALNEALFHEFAVVVVMLAVSVESSVSPVAWLRGLESIESLIRQYLKPLL